MIHKIKHQDLAKRPSFNTKNERLTQGCCCKKNQAQKFSSEDSTKLFATKLIIANYDNDE